MKSISNSTGIFHKIYMYLIDLAHARMYKLDNTKQKRTINAEGGPTSGEGVDVFQQQIQKLQQWQVQEAAFDIPPIPHRVVFWCSVWGTNMTHLVWQFCTLLRWPDPNTPRQPTDPGISWMELAISFMIWSNQYLPIRIKEGTTYQYLAYQDPQVQLLPVKSRSIRVLAENFRWMFKHIQTFSRTKIIPVYKKQGTSSLTRLGFTHDHERGMSRRPQLPNAAETYGTIHTMLKTMPHDPPFHTEILLPSLTSKPRSTPMAKLARS